MPLQFQKQTLNRDDQAEFEFDAPIASYLVGISRFYLTYGSEDHHVKRISVGLTANKSGSQRVSVTPTLILSDSSGNVIDTADSVVDVVVLAWTGASPGSLVLASQDSIPSNGRSNPIALPDSNLAINQAVLTGFDLAYSGSDHHVDSAYAAVGAISEGTDGSITGKADMADKSGNRAGSPTFNGGLIAASEDDLGFVLATLDNQQLTKGTKTVDFTDLVPPGTANLKSATALITRFAVEFATSSDHHVKSLGAGCDNCFFDAQNLLKVVVQNPYALIRDDSNHSQDNSKSSVDLLVVGIY